MNDTTNPQSAVMGSGCWGRNFVRNFHALRALRAISDADVQTAQGMAKQHGAADRLSA